MIEHTLQRLREDFEAVQSAAREVRGPSSDSLSEPLSRLRRSLDGLSEEPAHSSRRQRRLRLRSIASRSTMLVRMMGPGTTCRWVNRAWLAHTGRSRAQTVATGWLQDVHPADRQSCIDASADRDDAPGFEPLEYRLRGARGDYAWVLELRTPRLAGDGRVAGYLCAALDVGPQREATAGLELQSAISRELSRSGSAGQAIVPILRLVCERLGWDEAEWWSADALPTCLGRWPAQPGDAAAPEAETPTGPAAEGRSTSLRVPVELHGTFWGSLRVMRRAPGPRSRGTDEALRAAATQLGQCRVRQQLEQSLQRRSRRDVEVLDSATDALIAVDPNGIVLDSNRAAQRRFGSALTAVIGTHVEDLPLPPALRREVLRTVRHRGEARSDGATAPEPSTPAAGPLDDASPGTGPLTVYVCEADDLGQLGAVDFVYQARLKAMASELLLVEENERRQLAADLHDGLGQLLALATLKLTALQHASPDDPGAALREVADLIAEADSAARSISFELSPAILHDLGLEPALQWLAENIQGRYGIQIELALDGRPKPTDERTRILIYRSIRELLINAAKHSGVDRVRVRLERDGGELIAEVADDGAGLELSGMPTSGFGLLSMNERLLHLGGSMRIQSAPGRGFSVCLRAPLVGQGLDRAGGDR